MAGPPGRGGRIAFGRADGAPFGPPEVAVNIAMDELTDGPALEDQRIDALVAFLEALTDQRYEHLLGE